MATRFLLTTLLSIGFLLAGVIQYEITASLIKFSPDDYSEYIGEAGYVTLYCGDYDAFVGKAEDSNSSEELIVAEGSSSTEDDERYEGQYYLGNRSIWRRNASETKLPLSEEKRWEHNLYEAFLWGSLFGPLFGSYLVTCLGPKKVVEGGLIGASLATLLFPAAWFTVYHYALCIAQGICTGMLWPAAHVFAAKWIPAESRSYFISFYSSWMAGWTVAVLLGACLLDSLGRDSVFYFTSLLVVCWFIAWQKYVTDSPPNPLNVSWTEGNLINIASEDNSADYPGIQNEEGRFPSKAFILSFPLWACAVACFGSQWGTTTLLLAGRKYLQIVYGFSFSYDGILAYLPFLIHFFCAITFGLLADYYREKSLLSTTTVRKILVYISHFLPGAIIFIIGYTGCDPSAPAALFTAAFGLQGALPAGVYTSALEMSPKFSGHVLGFVQTVGSAGALAASYIVKEGLYGSLSGTWCLVYGLCSIVQVISAGLFLVFGSGTEQQWDQPGVGVVSLLTLGQPICNDRANDQPNELCQPHQTSEA